MNGGRAVRFDVRKRFFPDGCNDNLVSLCTGGIQHQEGELAIPGDQSELFILNGHLARIGLSRRPLRPFSAFSAAKKKTIQPPRAQRYTKEILREPWCRLWFKVFPASSSISVTKEESRDQSSTYDVS